MAPAGQKYPAAHVQSVGCAAAPAHELPAVHIKQLPVVPEQAVDVVDVEAYPAAQVHAAGCAELPVHTFPAPQPVARQVPLLPAHAVVVIDVDA